MRPEWYADKRDLVKWSVLYHLAEKFGYKTILQIAFYRHSKFGKVFLEDKELEIPQEVVTHFRDLHDISNMTSRFKIEVFDKPFKNRNDYLKSVINKLKEYSHEKIEVFLDPDTGLEPKNPSLKHVLEGEAKQIWENLKPGDLFVFYQHELQGVKNWIEKKKKQLKRAIKATARIAKGPAIAKDVVFFYVQKR